MKKAICLLAVALLLPGCAANYERSSGTVGYQEVQLDANVFRVTFTGNDFTGPRKVSDFALLRSAELALEHGYRYFVVVDTVELVGYGTKDFGEWFPTSIANTIVCYRQRPKEFSYDANFVTRSISRKYQLR